MTTPEGRLAAVPEADGAPGAPPQVRGSRLCANPVNSCAKRIK